jgi:hypothetical protein
MKGKLYPAQKMLFIYRTQEKKLRNAWGTTRETIARYLSDLKKNKLIEIKPYQIEILKKAELKKLLTSKEAR